MKFYSVKYFVFLFFYHAPEVIGKKEMCDLNDDACVFNAANLIYAKMIAGLPRVEPSDPLHKEEISVPLPIFSYKLYNATMTGIKNYVLEYIKFYPNGTLVYGIQVPVTKIEANYELHGQLDSIVLNGKGSCTLVYNVHKIDFIGKYSTSKDIVDHSIHNYMEDFTFPTEVKGKSLTEYENLTVGGKDATDEDLKTLDNAIHNQVMSEFLKKHVGNMNDFLRIVPAAEVLAKE